jgi:hypothetical protein
MVLIASDESASSHRSLFKPVKNETPDLMEQLAERAGVRLDRRLGIDLIAVDDAGAFLDACAAGGVRILGVESFYLRGDEIHGYLSRIADFSAISDPGESVAESRRSSKPSACPSSCSISRSTSTNPPGRSRPLRDSLA